MDRENIVNYCVFEILRKQDEVFTEDILKHANPKIKGEITKGKLRWRGIYIVQGIGGRSWVEQRGRIISRIVEPEMNII